MHGVSSSSAPKPLSVRKPSSDAGFTLVEVVVATTLIAVVMTALTSFFISTLQVTNLQGNQQTAAQLATDGVEMARALPGTTLLGNPPSDPTPLERHGVLFGRTWSVSACWQPLAGGNCGAQVAGYVPFLRVVVTVSWPDRRCVGATCSYMTSTLVSAAAGEPVFAP